MRRRAMCLLPLAMSLTLAACGGSSYSAGSSSKSNAAATTAVASGGGNAAGALVKTAANPTLAATILTTSSGMTLYRLSGEQAGKFICTGAGCLQIWHPLTVPAAGKPRGVASLATVKRPEGSEQVTYKGMPLYTFASDHQPGDVKGQGLKDVGTWSAVTVAATPSAAAPVTSTQAPPAESSGGYQLSRRGEAKDAQTAARSPAPARRMVSAWLAITSDTPTRYAPTPIAGDWHSRWA